MKNTGSFNLSKPCEENSTTVIGTISRNVSNSDKECQNNDLKEPAWKCRYVVTLAAFFIHLFGSTHRTIMSVVIVAMVNNTAVRQSTKAKSESCPDLIPNTTENATLDNFEQEGEFIWSPETQGYILGCFFIGQMVSLLPASTLAERYGCRWILVGYLLATSVLTMLIPPLSRLGASVVIAVQTLRGVLLGLPGACITILIANWSPKTERGLLYSLIQPAHSLGPALGDIVSGYISESAAGWPCVFYTFGGSGIILAVYVLFFIAENPKEHPRISKAELNFILSQQECELLKKRPSVPWRKIMSSVPFYAVIFAVFGRIWTFSQFWVVNSTFLGTILHYPIGQNGLLSAIPLLLSFLIAVITSWISGCLEKKKIFSVDCLRKFWVLISCILYSLCLMGTSIAGCRRDLSAIFSILSLGLAGLGTPGALIVIQDMSPTFAGTLYSITTLFGYIATIILPLIVGHLTNGMQTLEQWNKVFFISIGVVMSSAIAFLIFGSAQIQPWNFVEEEDKKKEDKKEKTEKNEEMTRF